MISFIPSHVEFSLHVNITPHVYIYRVSVSMISATSITCIVSFKQLNPAPSPVKVSESALLVTSAGHTHTHTHTHTQRERERERELSLSIVTVYITSPGWD